MVRGLIATLPKTGDFCSARLGKLNFELKDLKNPYFLFLKLNKHIVQSNICEPFTFATEVQTAEILN